MNSNDMNFYSEYLFRIALKKTGDIRDAEDLTQEVLLAFIRCPYDIHNPKSWLCSVLSHKFSDMLRKKYQLPMVSIDAIPEEAEIWDTSTTEESIRPTEIDVRREVAYLAEKYRTVIVKHYLCGEKVNKIARELKIPKGTVLSRLSAGREQMRKGFDKMKIYDTQSYAPDRLSISCHGTPGRNDEPWSIVSNDLMKQNILIVSYTKPVSIKEIALTLGIPTAFIESAVKDLVAEQLMRRSGNRVFTDFIIVSPEDLDKSIDIQIAFTEKHYAQLRDIVTDYISELNQCDFVQTIPENKLKKLIHYFVLHLFSSALYAVTQKIVPSKEDYPERPNGGRWIAQGTKFPSDFDFESFRFGKYTYGGERWALFENFLCAKSICLRVYDTQPDLNKYEHAPVEIREADLAKLLYIISRDIPFEATGFNVMFCQDIPHLTECGILDKTGEKPSVDIPIVTPEEYHELDKLRVKYMHKLADSLEKPLRDIFPQLRIDIPKHLEGRVAEFRQYTCYGITMAFIKLADLRQDIDFFHATPPMILVIDDENTGIR